MPTEIVIKFEEKKVKNFSGTILPIAGFVFILAALAGLVNKLFDWHLGIGAAGSGGTEVPSDPVIVAVLFVIGVLCLLPILLGLLRHRNSTSR